MMNKRKILPGSEVDLGKTIDNIQDDIATNIVDRMKQIINTPGLILDIKEGSDVSSDFSLGITGSNFNRLSIGQGIAITGDGSFINFLGSVKDWSEENLSPGNYIVKIQHTLVGSEPVTVMNAFLFDRTGGEDYTSRNTKYTNGSKVILSPTSSTLESTINSIQDNEVFICVVKIGSQGNFDTTSWSFDGMQSSNGIIDIRDKNRLTVNEKLLDDSIYLFKNRDNINQSAVSGKTEFSGELFYDKITPKGEGLVKILTAVADDIQMTSGNEKSTNIEGTSKSNFYIDVGSVKYPNGRALLADPGNLTNPSNIRVYQITPTSNHYEKESFVTFRWNASKLSGYLNGSNSFFVSGTNSDNEVFESIPGATTVGKKLYFPQTDNSYTISSIISSGDDYIINTEGPINPNEEATGANTARIIDSNVDHYILTIRNVENSYAHIFNLNKSFVKDPEFTAKVELAETWNVYLQSMNSGRIGSLVSMGAGEYKPLGAISKVNYEADFENKYDTVIPNGAISLTSDGQGFEIEITGWKNDNDPKLSAHQFEVIYSNKHDLNISHFSDLKGGSVEHLYTDSKLLHISAGKPDQYNVGVRPVQNKYPVSSPIFKPVVSGGGGVAPQEVILATKEFNFDVTVGTVMAVDDTKINVAWTDLDGNIVLKEDRSVEGSYITKLDSFDNLTGFDHQVWSHKKNPTNLQQDILQLAPNHGYVVGDKFKTNVSKIGRKIYSRSLGIDFRIIRIEVDLLSSDRVSAQNPGIIRVYQVGLEEGGAKIEIEGNTDVTIEQSTDLSVKLSQSGNRYISIDGWDPDDTSPNNECNMRGVVTVVGRPIFVSSSVQDIIDSLPDPFGLRR